MIRLAVVVLALAAFAASVWRLRRARPDAPLRPLLLAWAGAILLALSLIVTFSLSEPRNRGGAYTPSSFDKGELRPAQMEPR